MRVAKWPGVRLQPEIGWFDSSRAFQFLSFVPVTQWTQSTALRKRESHVRIVPGTPIHFPVAQLVERGTVNADVIGSRPVWGAIFSV